MCVGHMQVLHNFIEGTRVSLDFAICGGPGTNPPQIPKDDCNCSTVHNSFCKLSKLSCSGQIKED